MSKDFAAFSIGFSSCVVLVNLLLLFYAGH